MSGTGENWLSGGLDGVAGVDCGLWVPGVDYIAGWREARAAAVRWNRALLGAGLELSALRAVASTNEDGRGVVRMAGLPESVNQLAVLLETLADGDDDGGAL